MSGTLPRPHSSLVPLTLSLLAPLAVADGGSTQLASQSSQGVQGNAGSLRGVLSADGQRIAFLSSADNLVPGDTNNRSDVFVRDLSTGVTTRVSLGQGGVQGNRDVFELHLSADGSTVAWTTASTNLVPGVTGNLRDVYVRDLNTGAVQRVSVSSAGAQANFHSEDPWLSADGSIVAFGSGATNLVPADTNNAADVFVHDRSTGTTTLVSRALSGLPATGNSAEPSMNAAGTQVVFSSIAGDLVAGDTNQQSDVFVRDLANATTTRLSVTPGGVQGDSGSRFPRITPDGAWVVFESDAGSFDPTDTNGVDDVFVSELATGALERVSLSPSGQSSSGYCTQPSISADGRFLAFAVEADDLDPTDTNNRPDTYRKDRLTGALWRVSLGPGGQQDNVGSGRNTISADGLRVAFYTNSTSFLSPDLNGFDADVYVATCPEPLSADATTLSSAGGLVNLELSPGGAFAGRDYALLGSLSGTTPGTPLPGSGASLPLALDAFTNVLLQLANGPLLPGFLGSLDAEGRAQAAIAMPALPPALVGVQLSLAFLTANPFDFGSNAVAIDLVP